MAKQEKLQWLQISQTAGFILLEIAPLNKIAKEVEKSLDIP